VLGFRGKDLGSRKKVRRKREKNISHEMMV
jgi:hypothetical protein